MTICKNDILINKIGIEKLQKTTEVDFTVHRYLPDCRKIIASKYINEPTTPSYDRFAVPANQFECVRENCVNTGTLTYGGGDIQYYVQDDAVDFANGVITFYITGASGNVSVKVSDTAAGTNADVYTVALANIPEGSDGYKAVVVDLSQTPTSTEGNGWTPNHYGAYITINATGTVGISSLAIYDSLEDFEITSSVKIGCLSSVGGTWDYEPVEATCFGNGGYDDEAIDTFERTVTGKALTPNYMLLNPMYGKGDATEGWDMNTTEKVVEAGTAPYADYGVVILPDKAQDECGFVTVTRADNCNVTDAQMIQLSIPSAVTLDEQHYVIIESDNGYTQILVNKNLVGQTLVVSYPQVADVEETIFDTDNVRYVKTRMSYTRTYNDGVKYRFVFDNVLITSFPDEVTDEETEFEFTVTIQKDANGRFGKAYRILG